MPACQYSVPKGLATIGQLLGFCRDVSMGTVQTGTSGRKRSSCVHAPRAKGDPHCQYDSYVHPAHSQLVCSLSVVFVRLPGF